MADKALAEYRKKRDFSRTKEPSGSKSRGGKKKSKSPIFVIQEHDASRLHYDFRLEIDGVLKSWAVPKGPSTDPKDRRLAMPTEDHPMEYADFEGVIPTGEYGGGTVMVWDRGTYRNLRQDKDGAHASMKESYDDGKIEVWLDGEKLHGGYALIRTGSGKDLRWLLLKMKDDEADARRNPVHTEVKSAKSGRTLEEIEEEESDDE